VFLPDFSHIPLQIVTETDILNFTQIRPEGAALVHVDRRTDMAKVIGAFRDCAQNA